MTQDNQDRHPGMMGDGAIEQNLGQEGDTSARIGEDEVKAAFETEDTPATRQVAPTAIDEKPDQLETHLPDAEDRQEALIDEGVEESFPASDPVSVKRIT